MDEYKPNSHKAKSELPEKKNEKVTTGLVTVKKKSEMTKFKDVFISEDISNVKNYVIMDVLVPTIRNAIVDIVSDSVKMIFGVSGHGRGSSTIPKISYNTISRKTDDRFSYSARSRSMFDYDELTFERRGDAEAVLEQLDDIIATYQVASVFDLYEVAGVQNDNSQTNKYGWTSLRNAEVVRVRGAYMLKMPKAMPID